MISYPIPEVEVTASITRHSAGYVLLKFTFEEVSNNLQLINVKCVGFEDKLCSLFDNLLCQNQLEGQLISHLIRQMISVQSPVAFSRPLL